jgi:hypothetical protein
MKPRLLDAEEREYLKLRLYQKKHPDWMKGRNLQARRPHLKKSKDGYTCACGAGPMKREEAYTHKCSNGMMQIPDDQIDPRRRAIRDADL